MRNDPPPSFSATRKWLLSLNVLLSLLAVLALVTMINYLAARHYTRFQITGVARTQLSPLSKRVLESVTNDVKITIFYDKTDPLYEAVNTLLKEYKYAHSRISVETIDYTRDPAAASLIKAKYKLTQLGEKDLVIFESNNRWKFVHQNELSDVDIQPLVSGQSREIKRTHFKGELMFTSAIFSLISAKPLKAYFVQTHGEHKPDSDDPEQGYSKFAAVLRRNNIEWTTLDLAGPLDIPSDCNLLIIAGPTASLLPEELKKVDKYLKTGGRLLALFSFFGVYKNTGLAGVLSEWGVEVGDNVVRDVEHSYNRKEDDLLVTRFGMHPITKPLLSSGVYMIVPRSVGKRPLTPGNAGAPEATELMFTGPKGSIVTDIRKGVPYPNSATDIVTNVPLAIALEKGKIKDVTAERGTTRVVVVGDSLFLSNSSIDNAGNSDFAALAVNWLLDRSEILGNLAPRPIVEYQTSLTASQMSTVRWLLLVGMPGTVLLVGALVWVRRRK